MVVLRCDVLAPAVSARGADYRVCASRGRLAAL